MKYYWDFVRAEIAAIIKIKKIAPSDFKPLNIHGNWKAVEEAIYQMFCTHTHPTEKPVWLWQKFKQDTFSISVDHPHKYLTDLIDHDELVWFFINGDKDKLWFYEGKINAIVSILEESCYIDELYIVSKKYHWVVCINHHDDLIATGTAMPERLRMVSLKINAQ